MADAVGALSNKLAGDVSSKVLEHARAVGDAYLTLQSGLFGVPEERVLWMPFCLWSTKEIIGAFEDARDHEKAIRDLAFLPHSLHPCFEGCHKQIATFLAPFASPFMHMVALAEQNQETRLIIDPTFKQFITPVISHLPNNARLSVLQYCAPDVLVIAPSALEEYISRLSFALSRVSVVSADNIAWFLLKIYEGVPEKTS